MEPGRASLTAMSSAYVRAEHLREDAPPWIVEDALAEKLLSRRAFTAIQASMSDWAPAVRGAFRAYFATRARVTEDLAVAGLARGRRDYVILGAGADTFAWRHARASEFVVWEVDHPDTQAWKRAKLAAAGLGEPANVHFVPVDLATTPLESLELPRNATWNWLGVTTYLERGATEATLRAIAARGPGTTAAIEFGLTPEHCDDLGLTFRAHAKAGADSVGEPTISFYAPDEIDAVLCSAGFAEVELLSAHELGERYLAGRSDLTLPGAIVIAIASV